jgi:hypothetical protein
MCKVSITHQNMIVNYMLYRPLSPYACGLLGFGINPLLYCTGPLQPTQTQSMAMLEDSCTEGGGGGGALVSEEGEGMVKLSEEAQLRLLVHLTNRYYSLSHYYVLII